MPFLCKGQMSFLRDTIICFVSCDIILTLIQLIGAFPNLQRIMSVKGELGELQIYFRKILLHQQKFLVVSILSNSPLVAEKFEKCPK